MSAAPIAQGPVDVNVSQQDADIFADYPEYTPGQIGWVS